MFDREIKRLGLKNVDIDLLAKTYDFKNLEEFHVAIGCGDLSIGRIINNLIANEETSEDPLLLTKPPSEQPLTGNSITVLGLKGLLTVLARCCKPAPGDDIVGYITRGRGATIHRADCPNILRMDDRERIVKVSWGELHKTYPVAI